MTKKALLIGINYEGTDSQLNGCINDVDNMKNILVSKWGFKIENITVLTDKTSTKPTKDNIMKELYRHVLMKDMTHFWFSYSGHGYYVSDENSDEADKKDETLVPLDYKQNGLITDDILHNCFSMIESTVKTIVLIDACHSGSVLDLKYRYVSGIKNVIENPKDFIKCDILMISGCLDSETSADAYNINNSNKNEGAMTRSLIYVLENNNFNITCFKLLKDMREFLITKKFTQTPQMCSTKMLSNTSIFSANNSDIIFLNCQL